MQVETLTEKDDLVIRRLTLKPGDATHWHTDACHRFTVVVRGTKLSIDYRDSNERIEIDVYPGLADWDTPESRVHRAINLSDAVYEEVVAFYRSDASVDPQPVENPRGVVIVGNSGSGKSTLARQLATAHGLAHLDLDTLAWRADIPSQRVLFEESREKILKFQAENDRWVVEGCYADLLEVASDQADALIYLNLPVNDCIANARSRPWEPHKYPSKAAQDENLEMLIEWISEYPSRQDAFSQAAHLELFEKFDGAKSMYHSNANRTSR